MAGSGTRSSDVRVAGGACKTTTTLAVRATICWRSAITARFQLQRADVYQADFAFGGQRLGGYIGRSSCQNSSERRHGLRVGAESAGRSKAKLQVVGYRRPPSMPTAKRARPGLTPVLTARPGSAGHSGRCRVDHQRAHVTDVGDVAVQLPTRSRNAASMPPARSKDSGPGFP